MVNFRNFLNAIANDSRIYTAEDIGKMTSNEFMSNEKAIDYQLKNLGIPRESDLTGNPDVVYVHAYTRDDGTKVKAHYRSKPDGVGSNNYEHSATSTGASANIEQPTVLEGGITYNDYPISESAKIGDYFQHQIYSTKGFLSEIGLNLGINLLGYPSNQNDAVEMWNMASDSTGIYNNDYIRKNGTLYNDVDSLTNEYASYKAKIKEMDEEFKESQKDYDLRRKIDSSTSGNEAIEKYKQIKAEQELKKQQELERQRQKELQRLEKERAKEQAQ